MTQSEYDFSKIYTYKIPATKQIIPLTLVPKADRTKHRIDVGRERAFVFTYFCMQNVTDIVERFGYGSRPRIIRLSAYCGAPDGVRCKCGAQLDGHDFGDEDSRAP